MIITLSTCNGSRNPFSEKDSGTPLLHIKLNSVRNSTSSPSTVFDNWI